NVCKLYVESPLVCVSGVTGSNLKNRIEAIMRNRIALKLNFARKLTLAIAGIAVLALPITVGVMNAPLIRAQSAVAAVPKFVAASIRRCEDEAGVMKGAGASASGGKLKTGCLPLAGADHLRSEERRVGKECRARGSR